MQELLVTKSLGNNGISIPLMVTSAAGRESTKSTPVSIDGPTCCHCGLGPSEGRDGLLNSGGF